MRFLVTGFQHTGTMSMSKLMREYGYDVQHEADGENGMSAWEHGCDAHRPIFSRGPNGDFDHVIHVVRNPLHTLRSSLLTQKRGMIRKHIENCTGISAESAVDFWCKAALHWDQEIEMKRSVCVRIENASEDLGRWLHEQGWWDGHNYPTMPRLNASDESKIRGYAGPKTVGQLATALPAETFHNVVRYYTQYGYFDDEG